MVDESNTGPKEQQEESASPEARAREEQENAETEADAGEPAVERAFFDAGVAEEEVDPELLRIPRKRRGRRHPIVSLFVIGLSVVMLVWLWDQFVYFTRSRTPVELAEAAAAIKSGHLQHNSFVRLEGVPDRKNALIIEGRLGGYDSFFKLHQADNRLFVQMHRDTRSSDEEVGTSYWGRLVRFDSLPHGDRLKEYFAKRMTIAHDLSFSVVKRHLGSGAQHPVVKDLRGRTVKLTPDSMIWINVAYPNEWVVQFSKHVYGSPEEAEKDLVTRLEGLEIPFARDSERSRLFWKFVVLAEPDQFPQLRARFKVELVGGRPRVEVVRRQLSYSARWNQLKVEGDKLVIDAADPTFPSRLVRSPDEKGRLVQQQTRPVKVSAASILYISTSSPFSVGKDAMVLIQGDTPGGNWGYLLLYVLLFVFVGINVAVLVMRVAERAKGSGGRDPEDRP